MPATAVAEPADVYTKGEHEAGPGVDLDLDLTWTTDGSAYHYELTTRYEIPCTVAGTVTIDGATITVQGQGQRDHSWGVRDWWAFGWCWCSMRLDDGTRVHLADIRMPGMPVFFGYIQTPGTVNPRHRAVGHRGHRRTRVPHTRPYRDRRGTRARTIGIDVTPLALRPGVVTRRRSGRDATRHNSAHESLSPGHGHLPHRRRALGLRLDRVEPA